MRKRLQRLAVIGGLVVASLPKSVAAQTVGDSVTTFGVGEWLGLMLRLGLVVGVIWGAVYAMRWYTRRVGGERANLTRALDIVETRSLGPNRALHLVRIGGRAVLIGVTPERINALMQIDDPEVLDSLELTSDGTPLPAAAFGALLAGLGSGIGAGTSKSSQALIGAAPRAASLLDVAKNLLLKVKGARPTLAAGAVTAKPSMPRRSMVERLMSALGFTPVETMPQAIARMRANAALHAMAPQTSMSAMQPAPLAAPAPVPRTSLFDRIEASRNDAGLAAVVAPSATQALRALSGYATVQQSATATPETAVPDLGWTTRDERIAEAQRAIAAAQQKAS